MIIEIEIVGIHLRLDDWKNETFSCLCNMVILLLPLFYFMHDNISRIVNSLENSESIYRIRCVVFVF